MEIDANGNFYIAGTSNSYAMAGSLSTSVFLTKVNPEGDLIWTKMYGDSNADVINDITRTADGGFVMAGYTTSFNSTLQNVYVIKTDLNGAVACNELMIYPSINDINLTTYTFLNMQAGLAESSFSATVLRGNFIPDTQCYSPNIICAINASFTSPSYSLCEDTPIILTNTSTGNAPGYVWLDTGIEFSNSDSTVSYEFIGGGQHIVQLVATNITCKDTSPPIIFTITPLVEPTVFVTTNPLGPLCSGACNTFYAHTANGGSAPTFKWYNSNTIVQQGVDSVYTACNIASGSSIIVEVTSNKACLSIITDESDEIELFASYTPSATISSSPNLNNPILLRAMC
ncbi:MAG: hypothetical protein M0D57_07125 [Sphingobacteriales bacterium JAD_PAG50586_3]|nr:MAG: hypothetical protein M0D57_07125 [Sphingobacteriales bacterium JAD_PAG50586_3]